ncbi:Elongator protein 3/MiaB/NifB [Acididesulfobacillus acetoxydans]|uniref:Elongator protein 3/MiaB/NifB n=1 Tax=Acididesulfobacillus acetoxydans TaxID=1561005 RepID=A0A8S0WDY6_9FIRM|nr:B12-binding domain-containing radical SAM protein [Acididesulfobacillus acetoxydans]CAA7599692.1 Elongator protein 3/MiaB/NifB [Acididesulfobacillus acetoxydans]CEJ06244.1 Radical SAM super protein [Acididesulfobacillus acetoxydans]
MRILLVSLNAKYVHTNLALRYLREEIKSEFPDVFLKEFTINQPLSHIAARIYEAKAEVVGFSCYIWNITQTLALIRQLRPVCPRVRFVLGGPEVSYETEALLAGQPEIDVVVIGEGERTFPELLRVWASEGEKGNPGRGPEEIGGSEQAGTSPERAGGSLERVAGIAWRRQGQIVINPGRPQLENLDLLPDPYATEESLAGRLVYVETSRGCPFACAYCLSSVTRGVRYLSPERFRGILRHLLAAGAKTVKFVDRTFNARKKHAMHILEIVREEAALAGGPPGFRVHCEMAGELLDQEWVEYLSAYPAGLLQLEIGVQSTHGPTLELIRRVQNFRNWRGRVRQIQEAGIPVHLDLIAGLPGEDWDRFGQSFNEVYALAPAMLQLGFLKLLKGSGLRQRSAQLGLVYSPDSPYTILQTASLSHDRLLWLGRMEKLLNPYYNSGKFIYSLRQAELERSFSSPFDFYLRMAEFWQAQGWFDRELHGKALFAALWRFIEFSLARFAAREAENWRDALRLDFYLWERPGTLPDFLQVPKGYPTPPGPEERAREGGGRPRNPAGGEAPSLNKVFSDPGWLAKIPEMAGMDRRQRSRAAALARFTDDVWGRLSRVPERRLAPEEAGPAAGSGEIWYLFFYGEGKKTAVYRVT